MMHFCFPVSCFLFLVALDFWVIWFMGLSIFISGIIVYYSLSLTVVRIYIEGRSV